MSPIHLNSGKVAELMCVGPDRETDLRHLRTVSGRAAVTSVTLSSVKVFLINLITSP